MRNIEELKEMMEKINEAILGITRDEYKNSYDVEDYDYVYEAREIINSMINKIMEAKTGEGEKKIYSMRDTIGNNISLLGDDKLTGLEYDEHINLLKQEFNLDYSNRGYYSSANVMDTLDWITENETTEHYISGAYLDIESFKEKVDAIQNK